MGLFDQFITAPSETDQQPQTDAPPVAPPAASTAPPNFDQFITAPQGQTETTPNPPPPPDKYRQAAIEYRDRAIKAGIPQDEGYTARLTQGATLGWGDEAVAGLMAVPEALSRGVSLPEAYNYTKARQDLALEKARENTGALGTAAEIGGGLVTGSGATTAQVPSRAWNYIKGIATGAGLGATAGAGQGTNLDERIAGAEMGGVLGGATGAALPIVTGVAKYAARPFVQPLRNPENIAMGEVAKTARDSGRTFPEMAQDISDANAAGQADYTLADAMGHEGQRKLTGQVKQPGPARQYADEMLRARDLNMPNRVGDQLEQTLDAPQSAKQATDALITKAQTESRPFYQAAEDVPTWSDKLQEFYNDPIAKQGLAHGVQIQRIRNAGTDTPFNPTDAMITGFNEAGEPIITGVPNMKTLNTLKTGLDRMISDNVNPNTFKLNDMGSALTGYKNRMLSEVDAINPDYAKARSIYRGPMEIKDAVRTGSEMPTRGRAVDNVAAFNAMPLSEQQGARIGYADTVRGQLEKGNIPPILREKNTKGMAELANMSLYQGPQLPGRPDQLRQFLNREETMQRTSRAALGGPATAENLADMGGKSDVAGNAVALAGNALHGNAMGMMRSGAQLAGNLFTGNTEGQRNAVTRMLLLNNPEDVSALASRIQEYDLRRRGFNPWTGRSRNPEGQ